MSEVLRDLVVSLSLDGDNFSRNLTSINKQIQEAESEFKRAASGVDNFEKSVKDTQAQLSSLQQKAVTQYQRALEAANKKLENAYTRQGKLSDALDQAKQKNAALESQVTAAAEGMAAVNAELDAQYDKEYAVIQFIEDSAERQSALDAPNTRYNEDRLAAAREYAQTLAGVVMPVRESADIQQANQQIDTLLTKLREYSMSGEHEKPAILQDLADLSAEMDESALTEYLGLLTQIQSLLGSGMSRRYLQPTYNGTTNRTVFEGSYPGAPSFSSWDDGSGSNRRMLEVQNASYESSRDNAVLLRDVVNGTYYAFRIFHSEVCADCMGGAKGCAWTNSGTGVLEAIGNDKTFEKKSGSNGCPDKSSNSMFSWAKSQGMDWGTIDALPDIVGLAVRFDGHVGYTVGGGYAVAWRGFAYGCGKTKIKGRGWTHWYKLPFINYNDAASSVPEKEIALGSRLLKKGAEGSDVKALQEALAAAS